MKLTVKPNSDHPGQLLADACKGRYTRMPSATEAQAYLRQEVLESKPLAGSPIITISRLYLDRVLHDAIKIGAHYALRREAGPKAPTLTRLLAWTAKAWRPTVIIVALWLGTRFAAEWARPESDSLAAANAVVALLAAVWVAKPFSRRRGLPEL